MDGVGSATSAAQAAILRSADSQSATSIAMLKKAMESDKSTVEELLPPPPSPNQGVRLDIRA